MTPASRRVPACGLGATVHPFRPIREVTATAAEKAPELEEAGEIVAQAMRTLRLAQLGDRARTTCATRGLASSHELSLMIDTFLSIRDAERRRYCLAMLRACAVADVEDRGSSLT